MSPGAIPVQSIPWYDAYPTPSTILPTVSREQVLAWINQGNIPGKDFVVIDVTRSDHTGGFIRGSLNLPIESLYPALGTLHTLFTSASVREVTFYCGTSCGRGNLAAAWFGDYLKDQNDSETRSAALLEGIRGWALAGHEYTQHMDEYAAEAWRSEDAAQHAEQDH